MGFNSPEWVIAFYGGIFHNNVVSGVYATNGADACQYQAEHSEAQVVLVDTLPLLKIYLSVLDQLPEVKAVVAWGIDEIPADIKKDSRVYLYKDFMQLGSKINDSAIE